MGPEELLRVADRVLATAAPGEQLEVVVSHSRDTEVRAYDGEIEAFTSAESAGFGVRVVIDGRQGFAYAGSLEADVISGTIADARDNAAFSSFDEFNGIVEPDGVAVADLDLYDEALAALGPERIRGLLAGREPAGARNRTTRVCRRPPDSRRRNGGVRRQHRHHGRRLHCRCPIGEPGDGLFAGRIQPRRIR